MTTKLEQEAIRDALAEIAKKNYGRLTPDAIVAEAQNKTSILHDLFEWNGKKAAHAWRLEQARSLIRTVKVIITTDKTSITSVAYIRDPDAESDEQGYVQIQSLIGDRDRARAVIVNEFVRAAASLRRAREIAEVLGQEGEVDIALAAVQNVHTKIISNIEQRPN